MILLIKTVSDTNFSILHINIRSFQNKVIKLVDFLNNIKIKLTVIAISETWSNEENRWYFFVALVLCFKSFYYYIIVKIAKVIPIFKNEYTRLVNNYRPISILGVIINHTLSWNEHIQTIKNKIKKNIRIRKIRVYPQSVLIMLYYTSSYSRLCIVM